MLYRNHAHYFLVPFAMGAPLYVAYELARRRPGANDEPQAEGAGTVVDETESNEAKKMLEIVWHEGCRSIIEKRYLSMKARSI